MGKFLVVIVVVTLFVQTPLREMGTEMGMWKWALIVGLTLLWGYLAGDFKEEEQGR